MSSRPHRQLPARPRPRPRRGRARARAAHESRRRRSVSSVMPVCAHPSIVGRPAEDLVTASTTSGVTAIVLCGGRSSRMGRDKAAIEFGGSTLLQRTVTAAAEVAAEIVLVRAPGQTLPAVTAACPIVIVDDTIEGQGPLHGIATGLEVAHGARCLVVAVDMPFLQPLLLRLLLDRLDAGIEGGTRWVVPISDGRPQSLCSAIARDALPVLRAHFEAGDRAPMTAAADLSLVRLEEDVWRTTDPAALSFVDVDTPEALEAARALSDKPGGPPSL
ncbi:MAG: molybdenum cofactor guanylyltransferase [Dehalococcoidia bacterium]|nr:MAG: molybdenum cofactor guanylyltransferase [Dehalococcoidia bacterium]